MVGYMQGVMACNITCWSETWEGETSGQSSYRLCMFNNYLTDISTLLGCGTVSLGLMRSISGQLCLKTLGTNHPVTQVHLPEENRPQLHYCKSLKTSLLLYCYCGTVNLIKNLPCIGCCCSEYL